MDEENVKRTVKKTTEVGNAFIKGNKLYHATEGHKYITKINSSSNCVVNVIDKTAKNAKGRPDWVIRFDKPHKGAYFDHINLNSSVSGISPDPHIPLPPGGLAAAEGTAKVCQVINKINKVAVPVAIALDVAMTGVAVYNDYQNGTTRNTVETAAAIAGGWVGGFEGAVDGAAAGTAICPGIGTIIGGIIGGIGGGIEGSVRATALTSEIADAVDYDVYEKRCKKCNKKFKVRTYQGEKSNTNLCPECR